MICLKRQRLVTVLLALIGWISLLIMAGNTAYADNTDVLDQAGILSAQTQREIKRINDDEMIDIKGRPQIAVVTRNSLKGTGCDNIDDYGQQLFDKYHFGTKGYDNGVLLIIILKPHSFRMQTGYGVEGILPDAYVDQLMTPRIKELFKADNYDKGTLLMVNQIAKRLVAQSDHVRSKADSHVFIGFLVIILVAIISGIFSLLNNKDDDDDNDHFGGFSGGSFGGSGGNSGGGGGDSSW